MKTYTEFLSDGFKDLGDDYVKGERVNKIDDYEIDNGKYAPTSKARLADYSYILMLMNKLSGRSYALLEASTTNKEQLEGLKASFRGIVDEQREKAFREMVLGE